MSKKNKDKELTEDARRTLDELEATEEMPPEEEAAPDEDTPNDELPTTNDQPEEADPNLKALARSVTDAVEEAEKEPGPFRKVKAFIHRMYGNTHFREFSKFVGERGMDFLRFAAKNKDLFLEIIGLTALNIRDGNGGKFGFDDIDDLIGDSFKNAVNIIDTDSNAIEFNVEWIEMAVRILIFILRNTGKLG